jgi:hypothetical protein
MQGDKFHSVKTGTFQLYLQNSRENSRWEALQNHKWSYKTTTYFSLKLTYHNPNFIAQSRSSKYLINCI